MVEWVTKAHKLLVESELTKSKIKIAVSQALKDQRIALRGGVTDLLKTSSEIGVPILIFSAGIADILEEIILTETKLKTISYNIGVVSNRCIFKDDILSDFTHPVFHVFNKKGETISHTAFCQSEDFKNRSNIILLGDSLGDITMSDGLLGSNGTIITVGFLNDRYERLPEYLQIYDLVITGDPGIEILNEIIFNNIFPQKNPETSI